MEFREIVKFRVDETDAQQTLMAKVYQRRLEAAALKIWKNTFKDFADELKLRGIVIAEPAIFSEENGTVVRVATDESNGRETAAGAKPEEEEEVEVE